MFADVDPETACLDPEAASAAVTEGTRLMIPVHLYGHPAPIPALREAAKSTASGARRLRAEPLRHPRRRPHRDLGRGRRLLLLPEQEPGGGRGRRLLHHRGRGPGRPGPAPANHGRTDRYFHGYLGWNERLDAFQAAVLDLKLRHLPGGPRAAGGPPRATASCWPAWPPGASRSCCRWSVRARCTSTTSTWYATPGATRSPRPWGSAASAPPSTIPPPSPSSPRSRRSAWRRELPGLRGLGPNLPLAPPVPRAHRGSAGAGGRGAPEPPALSRPSAPTARGGRRISGARALLRRRGRPGTPVGSAGEGAGHLPHRPDHVVQVPFGHGRVEGEGDEPR